MNTLAPLKHSGLGIASTVLAVVFGLAMILVFGYAGYLGMQANEAGTALSQDDPRMIMVGVGVIGGIAALALGALLGVLGLFVGERRRVFAWVGLVLNGLPIIAALALMALGIAMT